MKKLLLFILLLHFGLNINAQLLSKKGFMTELPLTSDDFQKYQFDYALENGQELESPYAIHSNSYVFENVGLHPYEHNRPINSITCRLYNTSNDANGLLIYYSKISMAYGELIDFEGTTTFTQRYQFGKERWSEIKGREFDLFPSVPNPYTYLIYPTKNSKGLITEVGGELKYTYDSSDRVIEVKYKNGELIYRYTYIANSKKIESVKVSNSERILGDANYSYTNDNLTGVQCNIYNTSGMPGNVQEKFNRTYRYDNYNNIIELTYIYSRYGENKKIIYSFENDYDDNGRITNQTIRKMLTNYPHTAGSYKEPLIFHRKYTYDDRGNWIKMGDNKGFFVIRDINYDNTTYNKSNKGLLRYGAKRYSAEMSNLKAQETSTNPNEKRKAARRYAEGDEFVEVDMEKAFTIYRGLANTGDKESKKEIAELALKGKISENHFEDALLVAKDIIAERSYKNELPKNNMELIFQKYDELGRKGDSTSKRITANMLANGSGVSVDLTKAFNIYNELAEEGDEDSKKMVADMLANGRGVDKNIEKALKQYLELLSDNILSLLEESSYQDYLCNNKETILQSPELIQKIVDSYKPSNGVFLNDKWHVLSCEIAANNGNTFAQYDYGLRLYQGKGVGKDTTKAIEWLTKSANDNNNAVAMLTLGQVYYDMNDLKSSAVWNEKAAGLGNSDAQTNIGYYYLKGIGVKKDKKKAISYLTEAANSYNIEAVKQLVLCYINGEGVKKNFQTAEGYINYINKIPNMSDILKKAEQKYLYGLLYENQGDIDNALAAYKESAKQEAKERYDYLLKNRDKIEKSKSKVNSFFRITIN